MVLSEMRSNSLISMECVGFIVLVIIIPPFVSSYRFVNALIYDDSYYHINECIVFIYSFSGDRELALCEADQCHPQSGLRSTRGRCVELEQIAIELGLSRVPDLCVTNESTSPFLFGVLRPCIVLPAKSLLELSEGELRAVLTRELVHFGCDTWIGWVQVLAQSSSGFIRWCGGPMARSAPHERFAMKRCCGRAPLLRNTTASRSCMCLPRCMAGRSWREVWSEFLNAESIYKTDWRTS